MSAKIVRVAIDEMDGWTVATSDDLPGLFIAHPDQEAVKSDIPDAIRILFKEQHGLVVRVVEGEYPRGVEERRRPWVTLPSDFEPAASAVA